MIKIGLTGGIGAGKTTVSKIFESIGIPVFNSDAAASGAGTDPNMMQKFKEIVGEDIVVDGVLDKERFRSIIFKDKAILAKINQVVTPYVKDKFDKFCKDHEKDTGMVVLESAILFELGAHGGFDYIITVTASEKTRVARVRKRNNATKAEIYERINNQLPEMTKVEKANYIIINEGSDLIDSTYILNKQIRTILDAIAFKLITKK